MWPAGRAETFCTDSFRCRFLAHGARIVPAQVISLLGRLGESGVEVTNDPNLNADLAIFMLSRENSASVSGTTPTPTGL